MPSTAKGTVAAGLGLARDSGIFQTSPGVLRRRVLGPWAEGVKQYLTIRLGQTRGPAAFRSLVRLLTSLPPEELVATPGPKGQLYHLARAVVQTERAMPGFTPPRSLQFRDAEGRRGRAIGRLRRGLSEAEAELLELRHARELSIEELAHVVELTPEDAELALDTAEAKARRILGGYAPDPADPTASAYVDAFALQRSWSEGAGYPAMDEDEEGLPAGTLIGGRYQLIERVGVGAFGDVYRADDVEVPGHVVALKLLRTPSLSESARQSALRELKLNAAVFHPSLVQFKDHGWFEQRLWFVMPWYEGETLEARMRRGPLSRAEARRVFEPLAHALAALHEAGIRHQDIKPENVLLTRLPGHGEDAVLPVLIDLGVAAQQHETMLGGTPLYFAPEVAKRFIAEGHVGPEVDRAADVFALALSLRNALEPDTQPEVVAGAVKAFVAQRAEERPPLPRSRELRFLRSSFERWLSADPLERPSAHELAEELSILTAPEERRERRNKVLRWLLPLLTTLALGFALVVYLLDQRAAREQTAARQAQAAAADARADLIVADARRQALEEGHAELLDRYEQSRMSRRDLAGQLATAERQTSILRGELARAIARRDRLTDRLADRSEALRTTRDERDEAREARDRLSESLASTRRRAEQLERGRDAEQARAERLRSELDESRRETDRAQDRADALATELAEAQTARDEARDELARVRAQIRALAGVIHEEQSGSEPEAVELEPTAEDPPAP